MTMWKRERTHFNYYVTNERKQPRGTAALFKQIEKDL